MQVEGHDVLCTRIRRYRVSTGEQAHQTAASYVGPPTDHAQEQQVHAQRQVRGVTCYQVRVPTRPRRLFRRQRHTEGHFGSEAAEKESNLGQGG